MDLGTIFRQVLDIWNNPPETELSADALIDCANRCVTQHNIDLDLTSDAAFETFKTEPFSFSSADAREFELSDIDDISRVIRVQSRGTDSTSEDDWQEETLTSYGNWDDVVERGDGDFVSLFGTPPALTLVVNRDASDLEFRVVYRKLREKILVPTQFMDLPSIYEPLLVYDIALEVAEVIDDRSPDFASRKSDKQKFLLARREDAIGRIEKWRRSQHGPKVSHRRAFNDRSHGLNIRRRRFTVNF